MDQPATSGADGATLEGRVRRDDVVVVLPTFNEAENLQAITNAIMAQGVRVLVVDDNSPDGTGQLADVIARSNDHLAVLHRRSKEGLGPAYAAGFGHALETGAEIVCEMDADFSHDPLDLLRLVEAVDAGADLVIGSRYVPGGGVENWAWHRRLLSRGGNIYAGLMLGAGVRDLTSGFRAFRAEALLRLDPASCRAAGYGFQIEMAWRARLAGFDITEIPIVFRDRQLGASKMDKTIALEAISLVTRWGLSRVGGRLPWQSEGA